MKSKDTVALIAVTHDWDCAMIKNDADQIGCYMTNDWTIIGPDGRVGTKAAFLDLIRAGTLSHNVMESHDIDIRLYGDAAVVIARGVSGGEYGGEKFLLHERVSCVFIRHEARWLCVSTHLSNLDQQ
ncbi:MAG TPA: nuclear transport factor 2 family protein [Gammaproteobacteria bacterium]|nr:nuclear transport factor 2 family protein [Gammaproteobacteria bacterium]